MSNGSKKALVIPAATSNASAVLIVNDPLPGVLPVTCLLITRVEFERSTLETLGFDNFVYNPELFKLRILGDLILNTLEVVTPAIILPLLTPATSSTGCNCKVSPSGCIIATLL